MNLILTIIIKPLKSMTKKMFFTLALGTLGAVAMAQPRSAGEPVLLLKSQQGLMAPVWSPDGDKIAVTTDNYEGIWIADADGGNLRQVTDASGAGYKMQWSADGQRLLGRTNVVADGLILHEVKVWNAQDGAETTLVGKTRELTGTPLWRDAERVSIADGRGAANVNVRSLKRQAAETVDVYSQMVSDPAGVADKVASLSEFSGKIIINPALSNDGRRVAFQVPGKGIYTCNADGTGVEFVCKGSHPAWLPDNSLIYTVVTDDGVQFTGSDIYAVDVATKKTVLLTGGTDLIPLTPTVTRDGKRVAFENAKDASIYVITLKY